MPNKTSIALNKYCANGNDYLISEDKLSAEFIKKICDRNRGVGADGLICGPLFGTNNTYALELYNSDGSKAEISGNGLACFAQHLKDLQLLQQERGAFTLKVWDRKIHCTKLNNGHFLIPMELVQNFHKGEFWLEENLRKEFDLPEKLNFYSLNIGNPHCVVPVQKTSPALAKALGPKLEKYKDFPNKTNVQFVELIGNNTIKAEVWERGSGYTLASGSSACAVGYVCNYLSQNKKEQLNVNMPGGTMKVRIKEHQCQLLNKAQKVFQAEVRF